MNPTSTSAQSALCGFLKYLTQMTIATALALSFAGHAFGANATFSTSAPSAGANGISQLTGHFTSNPASNQKKSNVGAGNDNHGLASLGPGGAPG